MLCLSLHTPPYMPCHLPFTNILMHLCPATRGIHILCHIPTCSPHRANHSHSSSSTATLHTHMLHLMLSLHTGERNLAPTLTPQIYYKCICAHTSQLCILAHTSHCCSVHTKYHTLYLLCTYRSTDNPCHTHSIHACKNIHRLCHTQCSLYIHTGTSPYQTAAGRHNYIHTMPCLGPAHNVTSLLQHKHTIPEAQITADPHRAIALRSCPIVYLLYTHIPGHTLAHGTCIRIQNSAQTQHPVHPHGDTPSLPCAPTHALAFPLDFIRHTSITPQLPYTPI